VTVDFAVAVAGAVEAEVVITITAEVAVTVTADVAVIVTAEVEAVSVTQSRKAIIICPKQRTHPAATVSFPECIVVHPKAVYT
jgi:2-phospho-L-lactate guanylyltransferase (CobY/MobA/RfbA family)